MKTTITPLHISNIVGWILLFIFLWLKGCGSGNEITSVTVPEVKGQFKAKKPNHIPVTSKTVMGQKLSNWIMPKNQSFGISELLVNDQEKQYFNDKIDSLINVNNLLLDVYIKSNGQEKTKMFEKSTQLNTFAEKFEDSNIKIEMNGIVRGEIKSIEPFYTIKEKKIPQKEVKFRLLSGVSIANDIRFQKPLFNANLGFQNKRGSVLRIGYDSESRVFIGYDFSLFHINSKD